MKCKPYLVYKPSGVEWLGDVPLHWDIKRIKNVFRLKTKKLGESVFRIALENIESWTGKYINTETDYFGDGISFVKGDILFGKLRPYLAKVYLAETSGEAIGDFFVLEPNKKLFPEFAAMLLLTKSYINDIDSATYGAKMPRVNWDYMSNLIFLIPPKEEQQTIAEYLDRETARIDCLLEKKQRQIELLREKRTALISRAVTKGLDPNAPMKPSGIPWLGDIPSHWELRRIRQKAIINPNKGEVTTFPKNTELSFLPMECIGEDGSLNLENTRLLSDVETGYTFFAEGDVVYAKITPCFENGKGAIMNGLHHGYGFGTTELTVLRPKKDISANYLYYITISDVFRKIGQSWMYGAGGQKRVPDEFVKNLFLGWPPYKEYIFITDYLDMETARIDGLIQKIEFSMELLREYRASLISACVTGKIDVREC